MCISKNSIKWVVLLRGINVGGQKLIKMEMLRNLLEKEGFKEVKTYIQSGNIILNSHYSDALVLAEKIKQLIEKEFGHSVYTMARNHDDYIKIIENNPFKDRVFHEKEKLYVGFMQPSPDQVLKKYLESLSNESEVLKITNQEVYIVYMKDGRKLQFSNNFIERKLKVSVTIRNWNTVNKISHLL